MPGNGRSQDLSSSLVLLTKISLDLLGQAACKKYLVVETLKKDSETVIQSQLSPQAVQYLQTSHTWQS